MLDVRVDDLVGATLYVEPTHGWGWRVDDQPVDYARIHDAGGFEVRIERFFVWCGEVRGVVALVEASGHLFDGLRIVCAEMLVGSHDFEQRLCTRFDVEIGPAEASGEWPELAPCSPRYQGYATVARSRGLIAREDGGVQASVK